MFRQTARSVLIVTAAAFVSGWVGPPVEPRPLQSLDDLTTAFNADPGSVRVVLLLSPT